MTDRQEQSRESLFAALSDRYRMVREIGRGGMATVFLAEDLKHRRPVAIKVMRPEFIASSGADRFLREIEVAARLRHPHIVPLFDSGVVEGALFYVMAYEEGETLRERLEREKQLPIVEALRITREIMDALAHAHDRGVIHRDVKPANILLSNGHAMLADFGVARAVAGSTGQMSTTGVAVGTPMYMSPEQGLADRDLDGRSDVYSAGCVLYEMLVGAPPYSGPTAQFILAAHRSAPVPSVRTYRDAIPEGVDHAVARSLAKLPVDRFRSAADFRDTLERLEVSITSDSLLGVTPAQITTKDAVSRAVRPSWQNRWVAAIALILVLTGAAGGAVRIWFPDWLLKAHPKRVAIFPLHPRLGLTTEGMEDIGQSASRTIWYRLASAPGIQFVDASEYLQGPERDGTAELTAARKRALSRQLRADYLIDGSIEPSGSNAVTVMLGLRGVEDTINIVKGADGSLTPHEIPRTALVALRKLLPAFLEAGHRVDQSALEQRDPAAIVALLAGDRMYRAARFEEAITYYESALERDSLLAVAALKAAQAKSWLTQNNDAERFAEIAIDRIELLAPWYASYARGIQAYLQGDADAAMTYVRPLTAADSRSTDAWFLLGEIFHHLVPSTVPADSLDELAVHAFNTAYRADTSFSPALVHLTDLAMRRGDIRRVASLEPLLKTSLEASVQTQWFNAVASCIRSTTKSINPKSVASAKPGDAWDWGGELIWNPEQAGCARAALRATLLAPPDKPPRLFWAAGLSTYASLSAAGRDDEAVRLLTTPPGTELRISALVFLNAAAGANVQVSAKRIADSLGTDFKKIDSRRLWLLVSWYSHLGDATALGAISTVLAARRDSSHTRTDSLFAKVAGAHLAAASHDTTAALKQLAVLTPRARYNELAFIPWEAFAGEHMLQARLLEARGLHAEAIRAAARIDAPVPIVNLIFLRQSLALRERASLALGDAQASARYRERLAKWSADRVPYP